MAIKVKQKHGGAINRIQKGDTTNGGRPPLLLSTIVAELRSQGYERATANQVADAFGENEPQYLIGMSVPPVMTAQIAHQINLQWFSQQSQKQPSSSHG